LEVLESEKDRWRLWLPVGLGIGIEIYFGLMLEPSPWIAAISTFLAILAIIIGRRWPWLRVVGTAALLLACGLGIAQWHTHNVAAPKLAKQIYARTIEGRVAQVWAMPRGPRLLLGELSIVNVQPSQTPKLVRVTTRQSRGVLVGDRVRLRASVRPCVRRPGRPSRVRLISNAKHSLRKLVATVSRWGQLRSSRRRVKGLLQTWVWA